MRIPRAISDRFRALNHVFRVRTVDRVRNVRSPWVQVALETFRQIKRDDATLMAAGVAYYAVLSVVPLTLLLLAVLRLFADSESSREQLQNFFSVYLPNPVGFVDQISDQALNLSGFFGLVGLVGILWTGTAVMSALGKAINRAFGIRQDLPFYKGRPQALLIGAAVLAAFAVSLFGSAAIESVAQFSVPLIGKQVWVQAAARVLPFCVTLASFALIYKYLPNTPTRWRYVLPASVLGAVLFELAKVMFVVYVNRFADFGAYGPVAASLIVLMVWSFYSAFVVIVGAEVVAVHTRMGERIPQTAPAVLRDKAPEGWWMHRARASRRRAPHRRPRRRHHAPPGE